MCKPNVRIDRTRKTLTVNRSFLTAAGNIGSPEYAEYLELKSRYPDFQIVLHQRSRSKSESIFGDLSYEGMASFINGQEETDQARAAALKELEDVRNLYKGQRGAYLKVKEWFLEKYKDEFNRIKEAKEAAARKKRDENFLYHPATNH